MPILKVPEIERSPICSNYGLGCLPESDTRHYHLTADPGQQRPLFGPQQQARMVAAIARLMRANDTPDEAFSRLGL